MVKYKQENPTGTLVRRRKEEKDSMRSVRQKYISLILILSMFFLGMCCGSTQADSSLMYEIPVLMNYRSSFPTIPRSVCSQPMHIFVRKADA